ncbi:MAG: site-specific integrase [Microbacterium sp.]|jgi:integrase|nr:site-specific integrase [Microbacterium sp.]
MPRPPLVLETWGKIRRTVVDGQPTAVAYYRDSDGITRKMQRQGKSGADAERKLIEAMKARLAPASEDLTRDTRLSVLAKKWMAETEARDLASGTIHQYRQSLDRHIVKGLGDVRLAEASVPRLDRFLKTLVETSGPGTARTARVVLLGMFGMALRHGAIDSNPLRDVTIPRPKRKRITAPDAETVKGVRARFAEWDAGVDKRGQPRVTDLLDPCDMIIGTGMRTGELLALRWDDLDLDAGTATVDKTIAPGVDGKLHVQDKPKSDTSERMLFLPPHVVQMLLRRRVDSHSEFVFPSSTGTFRHPNNYRSKWREVFEGTPYVGTTPRSFRKAVATALKDSLGVGAAAKQLGHASETTTIQHYVKQAHLGPEGQAVLEEFFA